MTAIASRVNFVTVHGSHDLSMYCVPSGFPDDNKT